MNILVIGGMHGNEPLGIDVVKLFQDNPQANVDTLLANPRAIEQNVRYCGQDLNRSFNLNDNSYEAKRAQIIRKKAAQYDLVLDFHNTYCPDNDCSFVGESATPLLYDASIFFGLDRVIVADYDCINKYAPNCVSIEVSMGSPRNVATIWYELIAALARTNTATTTQKPQKYQFIYRMTLDDRDRFALDTCGLRAFEPLSPTLATKLDVNTPAYPIFIADEFTPYNYGGVVRKID